jgi:hypothetical protein
MTAFQTKLAYTTSKVKSNSNEGSKSNPLVTSKSNGSKPVRNVPCDNISSGYSDGEKSGLLGGSTPMNNTPKPSNNTPKGGDHSGFLGGSTPSNNTPKGKDHSGFLGGSTPSNNTPKGKDHSGFLGGSTPSNNTPKGNDHSGFLGGSTPSNNTPKGKDHSGFLGGSTPSNNTPKGGDHSGFLGGSTPSNNTPKGKDHSGFLGGSTPGNNTPKGGDHSGFLGGSTPTPTPTPTQPVVIQGTACNDTLRGNSSGRDTLVGTTAVARGVGERDVLIGGDASDTFVLGDTRGSFYVGKGNADYAEIQSFNRCNDGLQLAGSAQDYTVSYANGISSIYSNVGGSQDLIATVNSGCNAIDLTAKYCQFVAPSCGSL